MKRSAKPTHIPLFPDSYHKDTTHLTTEEHGAYLLLLMAAWGQDDCSLPHDERRLAALAKLQVAQWRKIAPTILEFWTIENGRIYQRRLRHEWQYVQSKRTKRKAAADARWSSERNANAYANEHQVECTKGGGGGGGVSSLPYQEEEDTNGEGREAFRVIGGGK